MGDLFRRIRYLLNRSRIERELADEMEFHREMSARAGHENFGNSLAFREQSREAWGWLWLDRLRQDLTYAIRMLRRSPGLTLAAVLMLAIGIGVNVAVFGFFDLMVLRPLNVREPSTLLRFHRRSPQFYAYALGYPQMTFLREHTRTLSAILALNWTRVAVANEEKHQEAHFVTGNFFTELGARPLLGRTLLHDRDDRPGAAPAIVLSHGFWQRHFGGDPSVVGRQLEINGKPAEIVGVLAPEFTGLNTTVPALWAPIEQHPYFVAGSKLLTDRSVESAGVTMFGRLAPGANPRAAETELGLLAAELRRQSPDSVWENETLPSQPGGYGTALLNGNRRGSGTESPSQLYLILGLVGAMTLLILAVACANLGSLLLARGIAREREISIRTAVGAGSARLVRQLLTESLVLATLGSAAGLVLGFVVLRALMALTGAPPWLDVSPDWRVAAFATGAGAVSAVFFGLLPALQLARQRHRSTILRQVLIGAQVAASCVLLIVAGLLGRALDRALSARPGFAYERVIAIDPGLGRHGYNPAKSRAYLDTLETRLRAIPGVQGVSRSVVPPLGRVTISSELSEHGRAVNVMLNHVDPSFLATLEIPLLRGRNLERGDTQSAVVGESLAHTLWPGQDPIGQTINFGRDFTVVGVAGSARMVKTEDSDAVEVYLPIENGDIPGLFVVARTAGSPEELARAAVVVARELDPATFPEVETLKSGMVRRQEAARATALAVSAMGMIAQLLACLGIGGVVSYAVSQRTREIGIRVALGAGAGHVLRIVLLRLLVPVAIGLTAGAGAAAALSKVLRGQLYGISNLDPTAYTAALGLFLVTAGIAALFPARRALRIDPLAALRSDQ